MLTSMHYDVPAYYAVQLAGTYRPYATVAGSGRVASSSTNHSKPEFVLAHATLVNRKTVTFLPGSEFGEAAD